jgi:hypothetical protein
MDDSDMDEGVTSIDDHRGPPRREPKDEVIRKRSPETRRTRVRDPGSQIRRLECFEVVDQMVRQGKYLREIVSYIKDTRGELEDLSRRAVTFLVKNYRESLYSDDVGPDGIPDPDKPDPDDPFYELHSMQRFYKVLEERIEMEVTTEKNLTKLFSTTHKEFARLQSLGEAITKRKEKLGLLRSERGGVRQRVGSGLPGRLDMPEIVSTPESRQKVVGLIEALIGDPELLDNLAENKQKKQKTSRPKRRKRRKRQ